MENAPPPWLQPPNNTPAWQEIRVRNRIKGCMMGSAAFDAMGLWSSSSGRPGDLKSFERDRSDGVLVIPSYERTTAYREDSRYNTYIIGDWSYNSEHAFLILLGYMHEGERFGAQEFGYRLHIWQNQGLVNRDSPRRHLDTSLESILLDEVYFRHPHDDAREF